MGKKKAVNGKCLLNEDAVVEALKEAHVLENDEERLRGHVSRLVHQLFRHEENVIHRSMLKREDTGKIQVKDVLVDPNEEFDVGSQPNLPRGFVEALKGWSTLSSKIVHISESSDYVTTKLLIELEAGHQIEAVLLRHTKRTTLCVSSQVGCKMGCTFCATGTMGQRANLTASEIQEQLFHANRFLKIAKEPRNVTNIVFMGMGEPLNNYKNVVEACRAMIAPGRFGLSPGKITVSTVGVVNRMKTLFHDVPGISLALSLHAPNQTLRQKIIPTAGAYPIEKLIEALGEYLQARHDAQQKKYTYVMVEYILLSKVNDMPEIAEELALLLEPIRDNVKVNLIPYNPIFNPEGLAKTFEPPTDHDIMTFKNIIQKKHGIFCTVRTEMGQDVNGACGQLACISEKEGLVDIEDLYNNRKQNVLYNEGGINLKRKHHKKPLATSAKQTVMDLIQQPKILVGAAVFMSISYLLLNSLRGSTNTNHHVK